MFILEASPIISDGPAWVIALSVVAGTIKVLSGQIFPFLGKKYDYTELQKSFLELEEKFEAFKKKTEAEKAARIQELAGIKKRWRADGDRLIRAETLTKALKVTLNKEGYDDLIQLFEEIVIHKDDQKK